MSRTQLYTDEELSAAMSGLMMWVRQNGKTSGDRDVRTADQEVFDELPAVFMRMLSDSPIEVTAASVRECIRKHGQHLALKALRQQLEDWEKASGLL